MSKPGEVDELRVVPDSIDEESSEESLLGKRRMPLRLNRKSLANAKPITTPTTRLQSRMIHQATLSIFRFGRVRNYLTVDSVHNRVPCGS